MTNENVLVFLSMVFKKLGLIANEFLSVICQFLYVGIINLSLEFYISHFGNKAINGFCNCVCFIGGFIQVVLGFLQRTSCRFKTESTFITLTATTLNSNTIFVFLTAQNSVLNTQRNL